MQVRKLDRADLRDDPFVRAAVRHLTGLLTEPGSQVSSVQGYLAGGLGVRCYAGSRVTGDIDMFFVGGRVLVPPGTTILVRWGGQEHGLAFDHQYTPDFGLLHPGYDRRAVDLEPPGAAAFTLRVLHPVDLAISKVARFQDHDRTDIAALAATGSFDAEALESLGGEALAYAIGNLAFVRANLADACSLVASSLAAP